MRFGVDNLNLPKVRYSGGLLGIYFHRDPWPMQCPTST